MPHCTTVLTTPEVLDVLSDYLLSLRSYLKYSSLTAFQLGERVPPSCFVTIDGFSTLVPSVSYDLRAQGGLQFCANIVYTISRTTLSSHNDSQHRLPNNATDALNYASWPPYIYNRAPQVRNLLSSITMTAPTPIKSSIVRESCTRFPTTYSA
jgi:hypothetical protein